MVERPWDYAFFTGEQRQRDGMMVNPTPRDSSGWTRCGKKNTGGGSLSGVHVSSVCGDHISFRRWEKHGAQSQPAPFPPITAPRVIQQGKFPRNPQRPINHAGSSTGQSTASSTNQNAAGACTVVEASAATSEGESVSSIARERKTSARSG